MDSKDSLSPPVTDTDKETQCDITRWRQQSSMSSGLDTCIVQHVLLYCPLLSSIVHRHLIYLFQTPRASEGCSEDILHFYFKVVTQTQLLKCYNHWFSWMSWGNPWKLTEFRSTSTRARNLQFIVCNVLLPFCLPQSNGILCILLHSYWWFMFL